MHNALRIVEHREDALYTHTKTHLQHQCYAITKTKLISRRTRTFHVANFFDIRNHNNNNLHTKIVEIFAFYVNWSAVLQ